MKKINEELIKEFKILHNNKYSYILNEEYQNSNSKITLICPYHLDKDIKIRLHDHIIKKTGCRFCGYENSVNKRKISNFKEKSIEKFKDKFSYTDLKYINNKTNVILHCNIHGKIEITPYSHLKSKTGCKFCGKSVTKTTEIFIIDYTIINNEYDLSRVDYIDKKTPIEIGCKEHGFFFMRPDFLMRGFKCCKCTESEGEYFIRKYLETNNIIYEKEKIFSGCKYKKELYFDFYLPKYNICIEFDGIQHFKPISYFGGIKEFNKVKLRDSIKDKYCIDNKINLIRISYLDIKNIDKILYEKIKF